MLIQMNHKFEKRFLVKRCESAEEMTKKLNDFCKQHKVLHVNTSGCEVEKNITFGNEKFLVYIATIEYEVDTTEEKIQDELTAFIERNLKDKIPFHRVGENYEGRIQKIVNDFVESDTYKNYEKELRNRYENE